MDADDFFLPTALGDFFNVAEEFGADVVHTEKFFSFNDAGKVNFNRDELTLQKYETGDCVEVPTLEPADLTERIRRCIAGRWLWMPWSKFYRRDFLTENKITFPDMALTEDLVFCLKCLCFAKNYLRVPHVTNIYRVNQNSVSKKVMTSQRGVKLWLSSITEGMNRIFDFMNDLEIFRGNNELHALTAKFLVDNYFSFIKNLFTTKKPNEVPKIFYDELQNPALDGNGKNLLVAYLLAERALRR